MLVHYGNLKMFKKLNPALLGLAIAMGTPSAFAEEAKKVDVLLIGGGIMSSTLGIWLNELEPGWTMEMVERLDGVAEESSNGWNNAGTGHSALAELNYTPRRQERQDRHLQGDRDQRVVPGLAPVLVLAGSPGRAEESALFHQLHPAHELRLGR